MSNNKLHIEAIVSDGRFYDQYDVCLVHDGSLDSLIDALSKVKESMDLKGETLVSFEVDELLDDNIITKNILVKNCRFYKDCNVCSIYGSNPDCNGNKADCAMLP